MVAGLHHLATNVRKPIRLAFGRHGGLVASIVCSGKQGVAWAELDEGWRRKRVSGR
jgi:hypothetical protein